VFGLEAEQVRDDSEQLRGAAQGDRWCGHGDPFDRCPNGRVAGMRKGPPLMWRALRELVRGGFSSPVSDVVIPLPREAIVPLNSLGRE
jgi:hypothetical protein